MKEKELRRFATCGICGQKILAGGGLPLFYRVTIERFGIDLKAVSRQQGLTMLLGGSAAIAAAMGPDEEMTQTLMEPASFAVCERCSTDSSCVAQLAEIASAAQEGGE